MSLLSVCRTTVLYSTLKNLLFESENFAAYAPQARAAKFAEFFNWPLKIYLIGSIVPVLEKNYYLLSSSGDLLAHIVQFSRWLQH